MVAVALLTMSSLAPLAADPYATLVSKVCGLDLEVAPENQLVLCRDALVSTLVEQSDQLCRTRLEAELNRFAHTDPRDYGLFGIATLYRLPATASDAWQPPLMLAPTGDGDEEDCRPPVRYRGTKPPPPLLPECTVRFGRPPTSTGTKLRRGALLQARKDTLLRNELRQGRWQLLKDIVARRNSSLAAYPIEAVVAEMLRYRNACGLTRIDRAIRALYQQKVDPSLHYLDALIEAGTARETQERLKPLLAKLRAIKRGLNAGSTAPSRLDILITDAITFLESRLTQ